MCECRTQTIARIPAANAPNQIQEQLILGPFRVFPGRLSVSRTFGDIEAKKLKYGGNPRVIVADPEIKAFKVMPNYDFILLACKLSLM